MVKISFFHLRVTNSKLKNIKLHLNLLTRKLRKQNVDLESVIRDFFNQLKKKRHTLSYRIIERAKIMLQWELNACRINHRTVSDTRIGVKM